MQASGEGKKSRDRVKLRVLLLFNSIVLPYITYVKKGLSIMYIFLLYIELNCM